MSLCVSALAAPSAFEAKRCGPLNIVNETTSTVIRDHNDCSKIWVMPPEMGEVKTRHFKKSGNLGFCAEMKNIQKISKRIAQRIGNYQIDIDNQAPRIRTAEKKLEIAMAAYAKAKANPNLTEFSTLKDRVDNIEARIVEIQEQLNTCEQFCQTLMSEFSDLSKEKRELNKELRQVRREVRNDVRAYDKAKAQKDSAEEFLEIVRNEVLEKIDRQTLLKSKLFGMYSNYAKLEGGYIGVNYDLKWDDNVANLEAKYPQFNFSKVATKDTRIHANFIGAQDRDTYYSSLPMILDYTIAGFEYQPYGVEREAAISSVPSEIQGDLRLSVIGACPYYYSNFLDDTNGELTINPNAESNEFGFGLSMSYKYPAVFRFQLEAKYNLYKFYKKVVKSGSKGGFFSKKSWKKVSETKIDKDTFDITWLDEGNLYTQEEKEKIKKAVKEELMNRALQNMAAPAGLPPKNVTAVSAWSPEPGALVVARGLEKTCGWQSYYCRAGAWVLKGLTSIFGSSRAEAEFQSTHDTTSTEVWNEENVIWRPGASSFVEK